jgi:hypothetical protein
MNKHTKFVCTTNEQVVVRTFGVLFKCANHMYINASLNTILDIFIVDTNINNVRKEWSCN